MREDEKKRKQEMRQMCDKSWKENEDNRPCLQNIKVTEEVKVNYASSVLQICEKENGKQIAMANRKQSEEKRNVCK